MSSLGKQILDFGGNIPYSIGIEEFIWDFLRITCFYYASLPMICSNKILDLLGLLDLSPV